MLTTSFTKSGLAYKKRPIKNLGASPYALYIHTREADTITLHSCCTVSADCQKKSPPCMLYVPLSQWTPAFDHILHQFYSITFMLYAYLTCAWIHLVSHFELLSDSGMIFVLIVFGSFAVRNK